MSKKFDFIAEQVTYPRIRLPEEFCYGKVTHLPQYVETHPIPAPPIIPPTQKAETINDQMRMPSSSDMHTEGSPPSVTKERGEQVWSSTYVFFSTLIWFLFLQLTKYLWTQLQTKANCVLSLQPQKRQTRRGRLGVHSLSKRHSREFLTWLEIFYWKELRYVVLVVRIVLSNSKEGRLPQACYFFNFCAKLKSKYVNSRFWLNSRIFVSQPDF